MQHSLKEQEQEFGEFELDESYWHAKFVEKEDKVSTAVHYLFTPNQIKKGHGLQLWLYGSYLQSTGKTVELRVVDRFGKSTQLDFDQTKPDVTDIESWLYSIQKSGTYFNLPEENKEILPLCM